MAPSDPTTPSAGGKDAAATTAAAEALPRPASASTASDRSLARRLLPPAVYDHLMADVDPAQSTAPLAAFCFMTGYIDVISFSAIFVWCGFQTGNSVQLALALARLFQNTPTGPDTSFRLPDQQALTSLLAFVLGAALGRIGDRLGARTRAWLALGTFLQALFTMAAALALWTSGGGSVASARDQPAWSDVRTFVCLAFISASLGLQGIMGKRVNTQFATTIVLTTVWCELMADPQLLRLKRRIVTRDHKLLAILALFLGGFVGRAILQAIGSPAALGIGAGLRVVLAVGWLAVPAKAGAGAGAGGAGKR